MTMIKAPGGPTAYKDRNSTADRALEILKMFSDSKPEISGHDVAEQLNVAKSTAYRYLQTLESSGFLEESRGRHGYQLGPRVFDLARIARKGLGLSDIARPMLKTLVENVDETVLLTRRSGIHIVCLERFESPHPARISYERGQIMPINAGASALVSLAWLNKADLNQVLQDAELAELTPNTLITEDSMRERLQIIRDQGFAVTRGEIDQHVVGIAAPIRDNRNDVIAVVAAVGLEQRITDDKIPTIVDKVCSTAKEISHSYIRTQA